MRRKIFAAMLSVSFLLGGAAYAQNRSYLSQFATGSFGSGSYRTTFVLFNNTDIEISVQLDLTNDDGIPLPVTIVGHGTGSSFTIQLGAGASQLLQTDGQGNLVSGAATVTSTGSIGVSAIFSIYDAAGNFLTETGVGSSDPVSSFVIAVDTTGFFNTGLALFNISGGDVAITMILRDTSGQQFGSPLLSNLQNGHHMARFISGLGQLFPSASNFQGTLLVQCSAPIAALVLRQNGSPLSFTSLPVVSTASTKKTLNLGQVANGGGLRTSFLIFNISGSPANVTLTLTKDNGSAFVATIVGHGTNSSFNFNNLAPGASLFLQTDGAGSVATGAATIASNVPIGSSGVFTVIDSLGRFQTETGVGDSPVLTSFTLPVDITGTFDTGVAFFKPGSGGATLTFRLLDAAGAPAGGTAMRNVSGNGHLGIFVSELFPGIGSFRGSLAVSSSAGVAALTLRQNSAPLSYTTLPVVLGTSSGKASPGTGPSGKALLSVIELGKDVTSNLVLDEKLPSGFKLTGTVSGPGQGKIVTASSGPGNGYSGVVNKQTGAYSILLPSGTYTLTVGFIPAGVPSGLNVSVILTVTGSVQVSGDTIFDIALPSVPVFNVSGVVGGLNNLSSLSPTSPLSIGFNIASSSPVVAAQFTVDPATGSYQGVLPAGTYTAGLNASMTFSLLTLQMETLGLLNLGSATISGNTVIPPFMVPATARLGGTIHVAGSPPFSASISAIDTGATVLGNGLADLFSAQYQLILPKGLTYNVTAGTTLMQGSTILGSITFPSPANSLPLNQDTSNYDLTAPAPPALVTISGHVTDSNGNPVSKVIVTANSYFITGGQISFFASYFVQTDDSGFYSLTVLSGTNYTISFTPPQQ
jgi:hypothetical protein